MNQYEKIFKNEYPALLRQVSNLPVSMYIQGAFPGEQYTYLCVIGARRYSAYGEDVCRHLIRGLAGYPIVIVSGLAIGIDSIAHEAALDAGLLTVAFPGSGLSRDVLYPKARRDIAERILAAGGALVSPFEPMQEGAHWTFPVRNRLMAGLSHATLVIEGKEHSGTLLTARHALEFGRDIMIVPGSIFSELSHGPHLLMRDGAYPVTSADEILDILGIEKRIEPQRVQPDEHQGILFEDMQDSSCVTTILNMLVRPVSRDEVIRRMDMDTSKVNTVISELELKGVVEERGGILMICNKKSV